MKTNAKARLHIVDPNATSQRNVRSDRRVYAGAAPLSARSQRYHVRHGPVAEPLSNPESLVRNATLPTRVTTRNVATSTRVERVLPNWPGTITTEASAAHPSLARTGRHKPPITPQSLGTAMHPSGAIGDWSCERGDLAGKLLDNLAALAGTDAGKRRYLEDELTLHWHALSDVEKVRVLENVSQPGASGSSSSTAAIPAETQEWLVRTLHVTPQKRRSVLQDALTPDTQAVLADVFTQAAQDKVEGAEKIYNRNAVEHLFPYGSFFRQNERIGTLKDVGTKTVAIVGAGASALFAGWQLAKAGCNVVFYEAEDKIGGRLRSETFHTDGRDSPTKAEQGAMRIPLAQPLWTEVAQELDVKRIPDFPNPGKVPTVILWKGERIPFKDGKPDHPFIRKISDQLDVMLKSLTDPLDEARKANDTARMQEIYQDIIDRFQGLNMKEGIRKLAKECGFHWGEEEIEAFGAIGIGTGGYRPFFNAGFSDMLRVVLNGLENEQELIQHGTTSIVDAMADMEIERPDGTKVTLRDAINLGCPVTDVSSKDGKPTLTFTNERGEPQKKSFDHVIFTGGPRQAEAVNLTHPADPESDPLVSQQVATALQEIHMASASKLFIEVDKPFWKETEKKTQCIITDQDGQMAYAYQYPGTDKAVVLVSYAWEDKANSLSRFSDPDKRLAYVKGQLAKADPEFASKLVPAEGTRVRMVDWMLEEHQAGAFALDNTSQLTKTNALFANYLNVLPDNEQPNSGVTLANDALGHHGGWLIGALRAGMNASCAALQGVGGEVASGSPLEMNPKLYDFTPPSVTASA
jgi:tryptophan 2-monooxygenase